MKKRSDTPLAVALVLGIAVTHFGYEPLAHFFYGTDAERAARALFYVLRGLEGVGLFLVLGFAHRSLFVRAACLWGMVEEGQTAACRLAYPLGDTVPYSAFSGLCGTAAYSAGATAAAVFAWHLIRRKE